MIIEMQPVDTYEYDADMDPAASIVSLLPEACGQCVNVASELQWWLYDPRMPTAKKAAAFIIDQHNESHLEVTSYM